VTGSQKKVGLSVFWGGLLLLAAGSAFLVYLAIKEYRAERDRLTSVKGSLEALYKMAPFPSSRNVDLETQNMGTLRTALGDLQAALAKRQVEPTELKQPTVFMESFWQAQRDLVNHAKTLGITLPAGFGFGLDAYLKGAPPKPDHVPRLMQQLTIIKSLTDLLFAAKVSAIDAIGREDFEGDGGVSAAEAAAPEAGGGRRGRRVAEAARGGADPSANVMMSNPGAGLLTPGELFSKMRFVLLFKAKENNVAQVLNALAANDMFIVVREMSWRAPRDQVTIRKQVFGEAAAGKDAPPGQAKESRIVSGREATLAIRLDLDVYRFTRKAE
jgi:hypothetical protein